MKVETIKQLGAKARSLLDEGKIEEARAIIKRLETEAHELNNSLYLKNKIKYNKKAG